MCMYYQAKYKKTLYEPEVCIQGECGKQKTRTRIQRYDATNSHTFRTAFGFDFVFVFAFDFTTTCFLGVGSESLLSDSDDEEESDESEESETVDFQSMIARKTDC